jgi:hypothetical protein
VRRVRRVRWAIGAWWQVSARRYPGVQHMSKGQAHQRMAVVPLVVLIWRATADPMFWSGMTKPVVLEALWVTLVTATATLLASVAAGIPLA